eukprot:3718661-Ditylum_brightwellii.AAC.1
MSPEIRSKPKKSSSNKGMLHAGMKEDCIQEYIHEGSLCVCHIPGKQNISNLHTKEQKDISLFLVTRDCTALIP